MRWELGATPAKRVDMPPDPHRCCRNLCEVSLPRSPSVAALAVGRCRNCRRGDAGRCPARARRRSGRDADRPGGRDDDDRHRAGPAARRRHAAGDNGRHASAGHRSAGPARGADDHCNHVDHDTCSGADGHHRCRRCCRCTTTARRRRAPAERGKNGKKAAKQGKKHKPHAHKKAGATPAVLAPGDRHLLAAARSFGSAVPVPIYQAACVCRIHWQVLAAINEIESGYGWPQRVKRRRAGLDAVHARAWKRYGVDANGDGKRDVQPRRRDLRGGAVRRRPAARTTSASRSTCNHAGT